MLLELQAQISAQREAIEQLSQSSTEQRKIVVEVADELTQDVKLMADETVELESKKVQDVLAQAEELQQVSDRMQSGTEQPEPLLGEPPRSLSLSLFTPLGNLDVHRLATIEPALKSTEEANPTECAHQCEQRLDCRSFVWHPKLCELYSLSLATDSDAQYFERRISASEVSASNRNKLK